MIYEVTITEQANADLRKIYEYIAFELLSPENAAGQLDRLEENIIEHYCQTAHCGRHKPHFDFGDFASSIAQSCR